MVRAQNFGNILASDILARWNNKFSAVLSWEVKAIDSSKEPPKWQGDGNLKLAEFWDIKWQVGVYIYISILFLELGERHRSRWLAYQRAIARCLRPCPPINWFKNVRVDPVEIVKILEQVTIVEFFKPFSPRSKMARKWKIWIPNDWTKSYSKQPLWKSRESFSECIPKSL